VNGELYFAADDGAHGWELWKSDGTSAGTQMVDDLAPPPASGSPEDGSYPANLVDVNNTLYFTASADYGLPSLYTLDAATQQPVLVDPAADRPVDPQQLTPAGDGFFFTAQTSSGGTALWYSNGMAAGTSQIATINPNGEPNISAMTAMGGELYFTADDGVHGGELWCSDGTAVGTQLLADVQAGAGSSSPGTVTDFNDTLIFNADVDGVGEEPFADSLSAPVAPTASLMMAMKSGLSNDAQPTVTGTATAGATVYLFADGRPVASGVAGSTGQFVVQSTVPLANGKHELTVADEIDGVTSSNSAPLSLTIDTTRPTDKLLSASNASISIRFSQDVSATLKKGDFRLVNMKTGKSVASADLGVSYNRKNNTARIRFKHLKNGSLPTGHYELAISSHKVLDAAGNALAAEPLVLTIRKKAK
jgi:ELWxxDGT repeat protein